MEWNLRSGFLFPSQRKSSHPELIGFQSSGSGLSWNGGCMAAAWGRRRRCPLQLPAPPGGNLRCSRWFPHANPGAWKPRSAQAARRPTGHMTDPPSAFRSVMLMTCVFSFGENTQTRCKTTFCRAQKRKTVSDLTDFTADRLFPGLFGDKRQHECSRITLRLYQVFAEF